ncbi:major facilitator superfamily domain-containing protein 6-like [Kryptolebias marmoratus]|uniref:Major facilitator superfamily domain containing 6-like n=1 Tax=Kryptolebias marmoratus TaxID=37003 RepID=A0A3Q3AZ83_KRYMA|nr:major facilitator superfamily domain-containing protein 6-like [Kryptolebias marmoratus]
MRRTKQINIKRALALAGTFGFLRSCSKACLLPFLTLYFRQLGLCPAMAGIVVGARHLMALVWSPVASLLAKHYNKRRAAVGCSLVLSAAAALTLLVLPPAGAPCAPAGSCNASNPSSAPSQSLHDPLNTTSARIRPHTLTAVPSNTSADAKPAPEARNASSSDHRDKPHPPLSKENASVVLNSGREEINTVNSTVSSLEAKVRHNRSVFALDQPEEAQTRRSGFLGSLKEMDSQSQLFFLILIIVSVWELVSAPLEWTVDDGLYEYLDFADASDHYSSTEVWGLLGAACGVGGAGLLVSRLGCLIAADTPRSAVHFYCYAGLVTAALPVAACLPLYLSKKRDRASGLLKAMQLVHGSPRALLCAATVFLAGVARSAVENFLLWQMQDHGSSELHMGVSLSVAVLSEAAFPLLSARVSKLLSPGRVLVVGTASLGLQCLYYSFLWGPWAALPAQVLSSFSAGALWWAVRIQCEDVATPGTERRVRRVFDCLCLLLGSGLGSFAGGFVAQRFGVKWLFRGVAALLTAWCVCLPLLQWKAPRQRRINYSRLLAADASEASDSESEQERDWLEKAMEDDRGNNNYDGRKSF